MSDDLTRDAFLGGRLHIRQPARGYRAGVDAVLLAASVPAEPGQRVLELGCGAGAAMLCLHARVPDLALTGVELQARYADLARANATEAGAMADIHTADLAALPAALRQMQFHHVLMNPPYFEPGRGHRAKDAGRDVALRGQTPLAMWLDTGIRRLAPKGYLTIIQHISRLPEVMCAVHSRLGEIVLRPIQPRQSRAPNLFVLRGRLDGRTPFHAAAQLVMHAGLQHDSDDDDYTPQVRAILRDGTDLPLRD